jgi:hypothetical protein
MQRIACLGITGVTRTAPTAATEVLLGLLPLHSQLRMRSEEAYIDSTASINVNPNLKVLDKHT